MFHWRVQNSPGGQGGLTTGTSLLSAKRQRRPSVQPSNRGRACSRRTEDPTFIPYRAHRSRHARAAHQGADRRVPNPGPSKGERLQEADRRGWTFPCPSCPDRMLDRGLSVGREESPAGTPPTWPSRRRSPWEPGSLVDGWIGSCTDEARRSPSGCRLGGTTCIAGVHDIPSREPRFLSQGNRAVIGRPRNCDWCRLPPCRHLVAAELDFAEDTACRFRRVRG